MCRLTAIIPKKDNYDINLIISILTGIMLTNSYDFGNEDGVGVAFKFTKSNKITKMDIPGYKFLTSEDWFIWLDEKIKRTNDKLEFVIGHIRAASKKIPVNMETTHPFLEKNIVGIHNGFIANKDEFYKNEVSDSRAFFKYLADKTENDILNEKILVDAISKIRGSFCFNIFDTRDDKLWVVTGKTRELYITENDDLLVINTTDTGIEVGLKLLKLYAQLFGIKFLDFEKPTKLEEETIFKVENGIIVPTKKIKENQFLNITIDQYFDNSKPISNLWRELQEKAHLDTRELFILAKVCGIELINTDPDIFWLYLSKEKIKHLIEFIDYLKDNNHIDNLENKAEIWKEIKTITRDKYNITKSNVLQNFVVSRIDKTFVFPYWLNSMEKLEQISKEVVNGKHLSI